MKTKMCRRSKLAEDGIGRLVDLIGPLFQHDDFTRFYGGRARAEIEHGLSLEDRKVVRSHEWGRNFNYHSYPNGDLSNTCMLQPKGRRGSKTITLTIQETKREYLPS
ncbi:hypothetical protein Lal_00032012 [Lupinus albus]|nr:hypothetical protein Lal_00032012 [Lupinus albus]